MRKSGQVVVTKATRGAEIRDLIVSYAQEEWTFTQVGTIRLPTLEKSGWRATLLTRFANVQREPQIKSYDQAVLWQKVRPPAENLLDLYVDALGKVLSIEWSGDALPRVISMKRGQWEQDLFGLPWIPQ